jgi:cytochrome P450
MSSNPLRRIGGDLAAERRISVPFPPGWTRPSVSLTRRMATEPLPVLLAAYERFGPVFSLRILHGVNVFMLGPAANHHMLVSHADNFRWRDGGFRDLIPLLGDGLLTVDGPFHRRSRRIMLPVFHRERIAASIGTMHAETERALAGWRPGRRLDVSAWARELALRIAMRALFGLDPDARPPGLDPAREFERALGFYGRDYFLQALRGPGSPFARMRRARRALDGLILSEITRRRSSGERGEDILSLLLDAEDEDGARLTDAHVRDEVMTLLFAGHDTTTSTIAFLFHELGRRPDLADGLAQESGGVRDARAFMGGDGSLLHLDQALDETLRLYPPAWIGPRRSVAPFTFAGRSVPGGVPVNYCSWASHRLPDVWDAPTEFRPERFAPEARAKLPKGAYVPFGGGSRTCIGMRFGQLEVKVIAARILESFRLEPEPGFVLRIRQTPTIGPRDGMPMIVRAA